MVDLAKIKKSKAYYWKTLSKETIRNFDTDPLTITVNGHTLLVKNNEVHHTERICEKCRL
jgi:hypothetical protein